MSSLLCAQGVISILRRQLESDDDTYFFLIIDELHLFRGSAGSEVSGLVRMLVNRLGLDRPDHRHKLRILASSASLLVEDPGAEKSLQYLWDFFGELGTFDGRGACATSREFWRACVVPGAPVVPSAPEGRLDANAFASLVTAAGGGPEQAVLVTPSADAVGGAVSLALKSLGATGHLGTFPEQVKALAERTAATLLAACAGSGSDGVRARTASDLSERLFGTVDPLALRGVLLARAFGDALADITPEGPRIAPTTPSFRIHLFFRALEGLFAALAKDAGGAPVFEYLSIERGVGLAPPSTGSDTLGKRLVELLYCEACGELFVGGIRSTSKPDRPIDLLPATANLESLPFAAAGTEFEVPPTVSL